MQVNQMISEERKRQFIDLHAQQTNGMMCPPRFTDPKAGQSCQG